MSEAGVTIEYKVHFKTGRQGRKLIKNGPVPCVDEGTSGQVPRISQLMALAIWSEKLMQHGGIRDFADLARLGQISRARVSQIMNLLHLAPDIKEEILFLPKHTQGRDPITERHLRRLVAIVEWESQRLIWREILSSSCF